MLFPLGIVLVTPEKLVIEKSLQLGFLATNNKVEYEALLAGMTMVSQLRKEVIELYSDSRLVVGQVNEEFEAWDKRIQGYLAKVKQARVHFRSFTLKQIPKGQNFHANSLAMLETSLGQIYLRLLLLKIWLVPVLRRSPWSGYIAFKLSRVGWTP